MAVSVRFEDPDGDPLRIWWSHSPEAARADTVLGVGYPPCRVYVTACDPKGNCTPAFLDMRLGPKDVPPGTMQDNYCFGDGARDFPRAGK